jgi:glucose-1-phosphate adenylyltransferase
LTRDRAKPAVPLAGRYRLIDIPMSNCFHAGIEKIAILTQFKSVSLHRHIYNTYHRDTFSKGWVEVLAAEQSPENVDWYQGTADAVRKQRIEIESAGVKYVIILAGDHLYRMDYGEFLDFHIESKADITVAVQPVETEMASQFGILRLDEKNQITTFREKPKTDEELAGMESGDNPKRPYMGSMGIYIFNLDTLLERLEHDWDDFGGDIIPSSLETHKVMGFVFDGYWEDIGTIRRFYEVNLQMAAPLPPFNFYSAERPIYTRPRFLPGSKVQGGNMYSVLLGDGCRIEEAAIHYSVIGIRSVIGAGVRIDRSILMGADFYETSADREENKRLGRPNIGVGSGSIIADAIVDKNARIGTGVIIRSIPDRRDVDNGNWVAKDGLIVVAKNAIIPDGTVI